MSEEELKNKIELLDREIDSNIAEKYKLQEKYYELYELPKLKKKYLNKYFIYKNNSYSCPSKKSDYWNVYYKVIEITEYGAIKAIETQKDKYGKIESNITNMSTDLEEITEKEYTVGISKIIATLENRYKEEL